MDALTGLAQRLNARVVRDKSSTARFSSADNLAPGRVSAVLPEVIEAFELPEIAYTWLTSPNETLGGESPIDLVLRSDLDAMRVRHILADIGRSR